MSRKSESERHSIDYLIASRSGTQKRPIESDLLNINAHPRRRDGINQLSHIDRWPDPAQRQVRVKRSPLWFETGVASRRLTFSCKRLQWLHIARNPHPQYGCLLLFGECTELS